MKKLLALLLSLALVLSMAACSKEPDATTGTPDTALNTTAPAATTAPVTTAPVYLRENKLVYATTARFDGDFAAGMFLGSSRDIAGSNAASAFDDQTADQIIGGLLSDCTTLALQPDGTYAWNMTVLAHAPAIADNPDGTRTYTLQIRDDLCYNTGKAITARDYVFGMLFLNSVVCPALGGRGLDGSAYPNGSAFYQCQSPVFTDIRLTGEYSWSVTVTAETAGYVFASQSVAAMPWDAEYWFGPDYTVADDGQGCYLSVNGQAVVMDLALASAVSANFTAARSGQTLPMVTSGPYQLSAYDSLEKTVILAINPNYPGNFEGQKPSVEILEILPVVEDGWMDGLEDGRIHLVDTIEQGSAINGVTELIDAGAELVLDEFDRAGYGKLHFTCDITPTQFTEVRQAIAYLTDRQAIVDLYCQGQGKVVNGPYSDAFWMARESEVLFSQALENYGYNIKQAEKVLDQGGWTLDEYGDPWTGDGLRYKEVTEDQAEFMDECVWAGNQLLMPLIIKWAASDNNLVTDLLKVLLVQSEDVAALGMEIQVEEMGFTAMLSHLYRQDIYSLGETDFRVPFYSMFSLAAGWDSPRYDCAYQWSGEDPYVSAGYNANYLYDLGPGGLDRLSMDMVYGVAEADRNNYLAAWQDYVIRYNELLPDLPLYVDRYATVYPTWLQGYDQDTFWGFQNAIVYASVVR